MRLSCESGPEKITSPEVLLPRPFRTADWHVDASAPTVNKFSRRLGDKKVTKDHMRRFSHPTLLLKDTPGGEMNQADQWDVPRAQQSGQKIVGAVAFLNPIDETTASFTLPDELLPAYRQHKAVYDDIVDRSEGTVRDIRTKGDLESVLATEGQIGLLRSVEGVYGSFTRADIDTMLEEVVVWDIMWNFPGIDTGAPSSASGTAHDTGLTRRGKRLVKHLLESGAVVDLSHASDKTSHDVIDIVERVGSSTPVAPAIVTHSGSRTVTDHKRNIPDDLARRVAEGGGIIGIPFVKSFVGSVDGAVAHITHFRDLGLFPSIATASDADGIYANSVIPGMETADVAHRSLAEAMTRSGYDKNAIESVMIGSSVRYLRQHLSQ